MSVDIPVIILLCHGRKSRTQRDYFAYATHIDIDENCDPDVQYDLRFGLPSNLPKANLIQSINWFNMLYVDGKTINKQLINDVYENLQPGGYFIFHYSFNPNFETATDLINYLLDVGFVFDICKNAETMLQIPKLYRILSNRETEITENFENDIRIEYFSKPNTKHIIDTIKSYFDQVNLLSGPYKHIFHTIEFVCKKN